MLHDGHRKRMKTRFLEHGLDNFDDHNVLELLLFFAVPRGDTNPTAHRLMDKFGSLDAVFAADKAELMTVPGVGETTADLIKLFPLLSERYYSEKAASGVIITDGDTAGEYFLPYFAGEFDEAFYMLSLDGKGKLLNTHKLPTEAADKASRIKAITMHALLDNATAVITASNHTNGVTFPTAEDIKTAGEIRDALSIVNTAHFDHIIIADGDWISMAAVGYFKNKYEDEGI